MTEVIRSFERLGGIAQEIEGSKVVGLDIETTAFFPLSGEIRLVQLNTGRGLYVIDLFETKSLGPVLQALESERVIKIIHNAKFEQKWFLSKFGVELWPLFDTFRASALIHNGKNLGNNLWDLMRRDLKVAPQSEDLGGSDWSGALSEAQYKYAGEDIEYLPPLRDSLKPRLERLGLNQVALIEFGAVLPEASIEMTGFRLDRGKWMALALRNVAEEKELRIKLDKVMPNPKGQCSLPGIEPGINLNSPQQVKASFAKMGIDLPDTTEDTMAMAAASIKRKKDIFSDFMRYRKVSKLISAFGEEYLKHINPITGRVHTDFWPFTGAGRYSSSNPNLQQIPRNKDYRSCFNPGEGKKAVVADYSQIELRIAAQISGDPLLRQVYQKGEDAHRQTASIIAEVDLKEVTKDQRQAAKAVNFGLIYGLGPDKLVIYSLSNYGVSITPKQATQFIERYFSRYHGIKSWQERTLRDGKRLHMARTLGGRLRYLDPEKAHNEFLNTPVQGTGADGLKTSLRNVYFALKKYDGAAKMVHMVHDEIVVEADDDPELIAAVKKDVETSMVRGIQPLLPNVPVVVEADVGASWAAH